MALKMSNRKKSYDLVILSGILLLSLFLTSVFSFVGYAESEQVILDLYTQKGGQGVGVEGGTFGLGEAVRLMVQLDVSLPQTVEEASEFFKTQVDFEVTEPDGSQLLLRPEQADLDGRSIIAFMMPSNAKAGSYKATATYNHQGQTATDSLTFTVDPAYSFKKSLGQGV